MSSGAHGTVTATIPKTVVATALDDKHWTQESEIKTEMIYLNLSSIRGIHDVVDKNSCSNVLRKIIINHQTLLFY